MTIDADTPRVRYTANGTTTDFAFGFPIWSKTDLTVYNAEVLSTVDTEYTVTFTAGDESGGTVSFLSAPSSGNNVEIVRRLPKERDSDFATSGPFSMTVLNEQLDQLTVQVQDLKDQVDRTMYLPAATSGGKSPALPAPEALKWPRWNGAGTALENINTDDVATTVQASAMIRDTYLDGSDYTAGVTTELTMTANPGTEGNTGVYFDGVYQSKTLYATSGTTIAFTDPITAGTDLVEIMQIQAAEPQSVSTATTLQFETSPGAISTAEGKLWWDDTSKTLNVGLAGGSTMQVGQENPIYVKNESGALVNDGDVVFVSGSTGVHIVVGLADASDHDTTHNIGMVTTPGGIANNGFGFAVTFGAVRDLNTTGTPVGEVWNEGDHLYLSPTTPGDVTNVLPDTPNFVVELGLVIRAHVSSGTIGFNPQMALSTDVALTDNSNHFGITQKAAKTYVDNSHKVHTQDATISASSGTGAQTLKTATLAAGVLGIADMVKAKVWGTIAGANDTKVVQAKWEEDGGGSKSLDLVSAAAGDVGDFVIESVLYNRGDVAVQYMSGSGIHDSVETLVADAADTFDTAANDLIFSLVGNPANAGDTITINAWTVEVIRAP